MATESIYQGNNTYIREIGQMTNSWEKAQLNSEIKVSIGESSAMGRGQHWALPRAQMDSNTRASGLRTKCQASGDTNGKTRLFSSASLAEIRFSREP